jgi:hypothetical protein
MTILTSSATIAVGDGATAVDSVQLTVLPAVSVSSGRGRLVHPSLGTYDYVRGPDEWTNIDGDAIIPPIWASTKTLLGSANTLFVGNLRDVTVEERWTQSVAAEIDHVRTLLAFWMNPPDPSLAYVEWYPTYTSNLGYKVILLSVTVGGKEITLSSLVHQGWVRGPIVLKMKIAGRVE